MIARLATAIERLGQRVHGAGDAAARARGLKVERTGRYRLSRVYRDPRWIKRRELGDA